MKIIGIIIGIIAAWAVRLLTGWLAVTFGAEIDAATQADMLKYITAAMLAVCIGAVELFERFVWPPIKARLIAWWRKKFPPVIP